MKLTKYVAIDTETTGLDTENDRAFCVSLCNTKGETDFIEITPGHEVPENVLRIIQGDGIIPVFHNAKFDLKMFANVCPIRLPREFEDTMIMGHLLNEYASQSLDNLSRKHLRANKYQDAIFEEWLRKNKSTIGKTGYLEAPRKLLVPYAINDAILTLKLYFFLRGGFKKFPSLNPIYDTEKSVLLRLIEVERNGMRIDVEYGLRKIKQIEEEIEILKTYFRANGLDNHRSPKQVKDALIAQGYIVSSTGVEVLNKLIMAGVELAGKVKLVRRLEKTKNSFLFPILERTDVHSRRVHSSFNQHKTKTGRLSSSEPNFENITRPTKGEPHTYIPRSLFIPSQGYYFAGADYDQMEMRVAANISGDTALIRLFNSGTEDVYVDVAKLIWPRQEIDKRKRYLAKQTTLGIIYGMGQRTLILQARKYGYSVTRLESERIIATVHERFPDLVGKLQSLAHTIRTDGYVTDWYGRMYRVPVELAYKAFNAVVQGQSAGVLKRAFISLSDTLKAHLYPVDIVNLIHDEILLEVHESVEKEELFTLIIEHMEKPTIDWPVKVTATPKLFGKNWADEVSWN